MNKLNQWLKLLVGTLAVCMVLAAQATITLSQTPLLTQSGNVSPNLLFILDDSGSMDAQYLYQYGGTGGGYGMPGPGGSGSRKSASCSGTLTIDNTCPYNTVSITLSGGVVKPDPPTWTATSYSVNTYVSGSDGLVYQCTNSSGCAASFNPASPSVAVLPAAWVALGSYANGVLVTYAGEVWKCVKSGGNCNSTSGSLRTPGSSSRWVSQGLTSVWGTATNPWSDPGITLAAYKGTVSAITASGSIEALSPDVNRITYDPRVSYRTRLTGTNSNTTTVATPSATASFYVFFYGAGGSVTPKVSQIWNGTTTYGAPTVYSSYFAPYTDANRAASSNPSSALAPLATTGLSYPQCVGPCSGVSSTLTNSTGQFPKFAARSDCAGTYCTLAEEQQNYATWKKFYSNRMDLAKSGLGYAFQYVNTGLRLGWSQISSLEDSATSLGTMGSGVSALDQTRKTAFYNWLYARDPNSNTPLREALDAAGKYFSRADNKGPWALTPDPTSVGLSTLSYSAAADSATIRATHPSCRRSYTMLLTDGYYNGVDPGNGSISGGGTNDTDAKAITTITGTTPAGAAKSFSYDGKTKPYAKSSSTGEISDIAMYYWITDLRSDLVNNVPTSSNNPSFWQNMGFYGITLGIDGTLPQTQATLDAIVGLTKTWPDPPSGGDSNSTVDDLWHATVNARGRLLNAKNADELSNGIEGMLAEINSVESSQSGVAASALSLNTGTKKYTPYYVTGTWFGNVIASNLDGASGADLCTKWRVAGSWLDDPTSTTTPKAKHWYVGGRPDGTFDLAPCTGSPTTFNGIDAAGSRIIYSWNGSGMGNFDASNTYVKSATTGVASGSGTLASTDLINYLRGDTSKEDIVNASGIVTTTNSYRARQYVLGDVVNSTPTFIQGALDMSYDKLPAGTYGQASYRAFVAAKTVRTEGVLFAGANDGMLHGFRDTTGAEIFAFVPRAVMPNMYKLASRSYDHQYFVDGTTMEVDACLTGGAACSSWTNLLLGTTGAGAKEVFALDVTNPTSMTAGSVKWEITPATAGFTNLGNVLSDIQSGLTVGGQWVAIFGNGYTGADGRAHLYVADLDTGAWIADIPVGSAGTTASPGNNGLGGVGLLRDANQRVIAAYAGDLNGNLWKFDLSNASPGSWFAGLNGNSSNHDPLYKTSVTPVKPITAAPTVVKHPSNGYVVAFGTGKLFESSTTDIGNVDVQSLIGVWDSVTPPAATQTDTPTTSSTTTTMVQQTITNATGTTVITNADLTTTTVALNYYSVSRNPITWTTNGTTGSRGWFINLPNTGQRTVYPLSTLAGSYAAVDTVSPYNVSTNACLQSGNGKAWNYIIDMATGAGPNEAIFKNNGGVDASTIVSGYENLADGRTRYIQNAVLSTSTSTWFTPLSGGSAGSGGGGQGPSFGLSCKLTNSCTSASTGVVKRTWRQLFLR